MLNTLRLILPALLPSWRFFSGVAPSPRVEVKLCETNSDWQEFQPRPTHVSKWRMARRLLWNPRWNDTLYLVSLSERMADAETAHSLRELTERVRRDLPYGPGSAQFRLSFVSLSEQGIIREVVYVSQPFERLSA